MSERDQLIDSIVEKVTNKLLEKDWVVIGIDGRCGSGKSTIGSELASRLKGNCFHMDDFYLPLSMRTPERLSVPGGNVHYERFIKEVAIPLKQHEPITYRHFDTINQCLSEPVFFSPSQVTVIEGAYAFNPAIGDLYDIKLFMTLSPQKQLERIEARNGEKKRNEFERRWIPLEEYYIRTCRPDKDVDMIIDTTNLW